MNAAQTIAARSQDLLATGGKLVFAIDGTGGAWYSDNARPYTAQHIVIRHPLTEQQAKNAIALQEFRNKTNRPNADQWDMISDADGTL